MEDVQMEHGFLKAPWEVLVRNFRAGHKPLAREVDNFSLAVADLMQRLAASPTRVPAPTDVAALQEKLAQVRRKLEEVRATDDASMERCRARIAHLRARASTTSSRPDTSSSDPVAMDLEELDVPMRSNGQAVESADAGDETSGGERETSGAGGTSDVMEDVASDDEQTNGTDSALNALGRWEKVRLNRALVDYMLREGMYDTAATLTDAHDIAPLVDLDIFRESRVVIEALRRRDCSEGLRWCSENKRRLQKVQSKLEFRLRLQEFVELARARRKTDAIAYMKKYLAINCDAEKLVFIQRFMGLLVFDPDTPCEPYKDMYGEHKWLHLENAFKEENYRLHGLTRGSTIEIMLKAGLACLKTRKCGVESDRKPTCPTCVEPYLSLAQLLPRGRHENSILVCSISGEIMDENNPPMALPKGNVYSWNALNKMAEENDGVVTDPKTNETARFDELRKCFIM